MRREQPWLGAYNTQFEHNELWVQIPEKSMVVTGRASDLKSLLSSNKVSLLTREHTPQPRTGEPTPRPRTENIESINSMTPHRD